MRKKIWDVMGAIVVSFWVVCGSVTIHLWFKAFFSGRDQAILINKYNEAIPELIMFVIMIGLSIIYATHCLKLKIKKESEGETWIKILRVKE